MQLQLTLCLVDTLKSGQRLCIKDSFEITLRIFMYVNGHDFPNSRFSEKQTWTAYKAKFMTFFSL